MSKTGRVRRVDEPSLPGPEERGAEGSRFMRLAIIVLFFLGLSAPAVDLPTASGVDYAQFWIIGRAMPFHYYGRFAGDTAYAKQVKQELQADGSVALRDALAGRERFEVTATPIFYTLFGLSALGSYTADLRLFQLVSLAAFFAGLHLLLRLWGYSSERRLLLLGMIGAFFWPLRSDIRVTNTNELYLAGIVFYAWLSRRGRPWVATSASAAWLAFLTALKPMTLAVFPVLIALRCGARRWRVLGSEALGALLGLGTAVLVPAAMGAPLRLWGDFFKEHRRYIASDSYGSRRLGDMAGAKGLADSLGLTTIELWAWVGVVSVVLLSALAAMRRRARDGSSDAEDGDLAVGLGLSAFLLLSPLAWVHYFVLALPLGLYLMRPAARPSTLRGGAVLVGLLLLAVHPLTQFYAILEPALDLSRAEFMGGQLQWGNGVLLAIGAGELIRRLLGRDARSQAG